MALTANKNYLQPTGFKVTINRQNYPNAEYFAQSINHPGANVPAVEVPSLRVRSVPVAGDKINYSELTIDFLLDEDMTVYKEMYSWLERTVNDGQVNPSDSLDGAPIPTFADITLSVLTSHNNANVKFIYKDCIPTDLGSIQFSSTNADVSYISFTTSFRFSTFVIV
jgi:hypothetical protein